MWETQILQKLIIRHVICIVSLLTRYSEIPPFVPCSHLVSKQYVLSFTAPPLQEKNMSQIG